MTYNNRLAKEGGKLVADMLGTEIMQGNKSDLVTSMVDFGNSEKLPSSNLAAAPGQCSLAFGSFFVRKSARQQHHEGAVPYAAPRSSSMGQHIPVRPIFGIW